MSHTPGPWTVCSTGDPFNIEIHAPHGDKRLNLSRWEGLAIVYICDDQTEPGTLIAKANAALITAAPDLLVALEKAVAIYGKPGGPWNLPHEPGAWITMAEDAIAKAKGVKSE